MYLYTPSFPVFFFFVNLGRESQTHVGGIAEDITRHISRHSRDLIKEDIRACVQSFSRLSEHERMTRQRAILMTMAAGAIMLMELKIKVK